MSFTAPFIAWLGSSNFGSRCLLVEVAVKSSGSEITRYLSNTGFVSEPTDTPANTVYHGRISGIGEFTRRLDLSGSGGSLAEGAIELDNSDGTLDTWLTDIWAARAINIYLGEGGGRGVAKWAKSQFELVFSGTVDDIAPKDRSHLSLTLRDIFGPLNNTLSTATVGGTGDNKDALMPITLGECFNITPVLIDAATNKYGWGLNETQEGVIEVRDNGIPVAYTATAANGYFVLTNARYGEITADVQGSLDVGSPAVFVTDSGGLIHLVATQLGDGQFLTDSQIDLTALATFRAANTQPLGLYLADRANRLEVMQQLAASIGATVTQTYAGKMILVKVGFGSPVGSIGTHQMVDGTFGPISRPEIKGAIRIDAERNWTPQDTSQLAGSITAAQHPIFGDEFVTIAATDATTLTDYKQDSKPTARQSLMVVESDISTEAARLLALWKTPRTVFGFQGFAECLQYEIGDTITLTHERFGLSGGVSAQIVGISNDWINCRVRLEVLV